jgi:hypothetical protein
MGMSADQIERQLLAVLDAYRESENPNGYLDDDSARTVAVRARSAIERLAPPRSAYVKEVEDVVGAGAPAWVAEHLCAIVRALLDDFRRGALASVQELVHADLFDDFIEMALELRRKGFTGPAAVVVGSVLEEHLRKLSDKHGIPRADGKSVELLGVDLRKAEVISEIQRKGITAWYAQRTEAAHGRAEALVPTEVDRMIDGVRDFVARHPA